MIKYEIFYLPYTNFNYEIIIIPASDYVRTDASGQFTVSFLNLSKHFVIHLILNSDIEKEYLFWKAVKSIK